MEDFRKFVLDASYPILKTINKIQSPWSVKKIKSYHVRLVINALRPGDVFLTRTYGQMTNVVVPGYWKHSAMYAPNHAEHLVVESLDPVVKETMIYDFLMSKDEFAIMRPIGMEKFAARAVMNARSLIGKNYDYNFYMPRDHERVNEAFYCHELIYWAYLIEHPEWAFKLRKTLGVPTITGDDIYKAKNHWELIYEVRDEG